MSNQARWSVLQSYNLLKWHKRAHRAAVKALENGGSLSVVIRRIEEAMSSNRWNQRDSCRWRMDRVEDMPAIWLDTVGFLNYYLMGQIRVEAQSVNIPVNSIPCAHRHSLLISHTMAADSLQYGFFTCGEKHKRAKSVYLVLERWTLFFRCRILSVGNFIFQWRNVVN